MGESLRAGLDAVRRGPGRGLVAVHLVDLPDVGPDVVARTIDAATSTPSGMARAYFGVTPGHPVVLRAATLGPIAARAAGDAGAREYLRTHRAAVAAVPCGGPGHRPGPGPSRGARLARSELSDQPVREHPRARVHLRRPSSADVVGVIAHVFDEPAGGTDPVAREGDREPLHVDQVGARGESVADRGVGDEVSPVARTVPSPSARSIASRTGWPNERSTSALMSWFSTADGHVQPRVMAVQAHGKCRC